MKKIGDREVKKNLLRLVKKYAKRDGFQLETAFCNVMTDFMHLCDDLGFDFAYVSKKAQRSHIDECYAERRERGE
jgi:hypothetical protein